MHRFEIIDCLLRLRCQTVPTVFPICLEKVIAGEDGSDPSLGGIYRHGRKKYFIIGLFHQFQLQIDFFFGTEKIEARSVKVRHIRKPGIEVDHGFSAASAFGRNHNHAVGSTCAVDRCSCSILEYRDAFDIVRAYTGNSGLPHIDNVIVITAAYSGDIRSFQRHTVHHPQWVLRAVERSRTAYPDTRRSARAAGRIRYRNTRYLSGKRLVDTFSCADNSLGYIYFGNSRREPATFHRLVAGDYYIGKHMRTGL